MLLNGVCGGSPISAAFGGAGAPEKVQGEESSRDPKRLVICQVTMSLQSCTKLISARVFYLLLLSVCFAWQVVCRLFDVRYAFDFLFERQATNSPCL